MTVIQEFAHGVRVVCRDDWAILQQLKAGEWRDMRFFNQMNSDAAWSNVLEDAARLSTRMASSLTSPDLWSEQ